MLQDTESDEISDGKVKNIEIYDIKIPSKKYKSISDLLSKNSKFFK